MCATEYVVTKYFLCIFVKIERKQYIYFYQKLTRAELCHMGLWIHYTYIKEQL